MNKKILGRAFVHALLVFVYIFCIALALNYGDQSHMFMAIPEFFAPVIMLSLLVLSAAIMGILIFGKPVLLYMENQKKEAVSLVLYTIGSLAFILFLTVSFVLIFN